MVCLEPDAEDLDELHSKGTSPERQVDARLGGTQVVMPIVMPWHSFLKSLPSLITVAVRRMF